MTGIICYVSSIEKLFEVSISNHEEQEKRGAQNRNNLCSYTDRPITNYAAEINYKALPTKQRYILDSTDILWYFLMVCA